MNKRKLSSDEKRRKKERKAAFMTVFINGRQKRVRRPPMIDGMPVDEFIARNADPIWRHENDMWELLPLEDDAVNDEILPGLSPALSLNPLVSDSAEINEIPQAQEIIIHGQGFNEIPF